MTNSPPTGNSTLSVARFSQGSAPAMTTTPTPTLTTTTTTIAELSVPISSVKAADDFDIAKVCADFPTLARQIRGKRLVYLDSAASSLKPNQVIDRVSDYYRHEVSNVHRGAHYLAEMGTYSYEQAREKVATFICADSANEIIFTRGTTEGINLVAQSYGRKFFNAGDEIIVSEMEHHSNIVPWQLIAEERGCKLRVIPLLDNCELDFNAFEKMLSKKTKFVSIIWTSNTLGTVNPIKKYIDAAHQVGAKVLIDAAQSISNIRTNVANLDCDFLVFSGHKIFAPYGIGALYAKAELQEAMPPYQSGGSMIGQVTFAKTTWAAIPQKFEAGTPNVGGAIGLGAAIDYLENLGVEAAAKYEHTVLEYATAQLKEINGLRVIGDSESKSSIISFVMDGMHPSDIGSLIDQQGVAIRAGHHCCQPLMKRLGVPATARASFSIYNTFEDVDLLKVSLLKAKELMG